jgi:hypothetical protein
MENENEKGRMKMKVAQTIVSLCGEREKVRK